MQAEQVYIHRCYEHELGYRKGVPKKAGGYLLISKKVISFFPYLSDIELNDNVLINMIDKNNDVILSNYVYHNSKTALEDSTKTRTEHRLYITNEINVNRDLFKPNDIIVFTKYKIEEENFYKLNLFSVKESNDEYKKLNQLLLDAQRGKQIENHLRTNLSKLTFLEKDIEINFDNKIIPDEAIDRIIKNQRNLFDNLEEVAKEDKGVPDDETGLIKSNNFRDIVLFAYMGKCAITGKSIRYELLSNLEAAHVMPQSHNGPDAIPNGLALCRDLHWAFDKGFFTIELSSDNYIVHVHNNVKDNEIMQEIDGVKIFTPSDPRFRLHINALNYHKKHIYGTFKQIRSRS